MRAICGTSNRILHRRPSTTPVSALHQQYRRLSSDTPFQPGDLVLLRPKLDRSAPPILTRPLLPTRQVNSHRGAIPHTHILGKRPRDVVSSLPLRSGKPGEEFRLHEVKLEEYVRLSRRLVTPIYPADARLIVETLDLHLPVFDARVEVGRDEILEILEAGTGHGALTLYLARAIHGVNSPAPSPPPYPASPEAASTYTAAVENWKPTRRAVIHTLDTRPRYTAHASETIAAFKQGLYHPHIDFHTSADVSVWTRKALQARGGAPFLAHAVLDLPGPEKHLATVAQALKTDGCFVVFVPSVTQILACVEEIRRERVGLELEQVLELGVNGGSGGREWKIGAVKVREAVVEKDVDAEGAAEDSERQEEDDGEKGEGDIDADQEGDAVERTPSSSNERWSMICRPKVGERIVGGGFLGVWRKQRDMRV